MARVNVNQRIVPEAVEDYKIQPVATPVNKLERFSPESAMAGAARDKSLYDALAIFGKGVLDTSHMLERHAGENALNAQSKAEKNKRDWAEVSKNFEGMAKFNPYNKDAFKKLVAADITREFTNNLYADPDMVGRSPEEVANFINNNQQDMLEAYKTSGLSQKDYAQYLINYSNRAYVVQQKHMSDNAELQFKTIKNKFSDSLGDDMATALLNGNSLSDAVLNAEKTMDELGWTANTKAEVINASLQAYIAKNPEASSTEVEAFIRSYKINGENLSTYIPNMSVQMQQYMRQIKRANFEDEKFEFEVRDFRRKEELEQAQISFFDYMAKNPNATEDEIMAMAMQTIQDSGVEGKEGMDFLSNVASTKGYLQSIKAVVSDENELQKFTAQAVAGNLDYTELSQAIDNHNINWRDGMTVVGRDTQSKQQANTAFQKEVTLLQNSLKKGQPTAQTIGMDGVKEVNNALMQIQDKVMREEMTPEEAQKALRTIKDKVIPQMQYTKQVKAKNKALLVNGRHRMSQNIPQYNREQALKSIVNMGIVRNSQGARKQNISIADGMTNDRNGNGIPNEKGDKHLGTDVNGVQLGDRVYPPANGVVELTGYEQSMGYYAVIRTKKGYFVAQHLQSQFNKKQGEEINRNEHIGYVGNSGRVTASGKANGCLHIEFWDKDLNVVTPYTF